MPNHKGWEQITTYFTAAGLEDEQHELRCSI